ncbi:hypothetical protein AQPE_3953 [Aquipluma nitroreducens]|uniref:Uncharacterized protein n=1 Tax=Aquipluma nitroreducens TaxID=2010828 RepID=A0A5K7SE52_9BACT|nr:hypothetical protein AQPE_3953 [Aquipluma nitroreducens]
MDPASADLQSHVAGKRIKDPQPRGANYNFAPTASNKTIANWEEQCQFLNMIHIKFCELFVVVFFSPQTPEGA